MFTVLETETGPVLKLAAADVIALHLGDGSTLAATFAGDEVVLRPVRRRNYTVEELLAESDYTQPMSEEEREWLNSPPIGRELL